MKSTIGEGPSCLLMIGFQDHPDANPNEPNFLSRVPIGAWRSLLILNSLQGLYPCSRIVTFADLLIIRTSPAPV